MFSATGRCPADARSDSMCVYIGSQGMHHRRKGKGRELRGETGLPAAYPHPGDIRQHRRQGWCLPLYLGEASPEVSLLVLKASCDDLFPITLPVVTEKGVVKVVLGELVLTSGTDLNDKLQDFLLAVDRFSDEMAGKGENHGKIKKDFSNLLESSILQNKDNEVGVYIFRSYGSRLSPEQKADIAERAGEWFRKRLDETNNQLKQ